MGKTYSSLDMRSFNRLPRGRFGAVLADPPWPWTTWTKGAPYQVLSMADLKSLPVGELCRSDALLFMWVPWGYLPAALDLGADWGFKYKGCAFIWQKPNIGFGVWTRQRTEACFLFAKGKPRRGKSYNVSQLIEAPRRGHSRKPDETHGRIEALIDGPYLELFARRCSPLWNAWGNETRKFIDDKAA